jgi:Protein of unknown function (DUF2442)
MFRPIEVKALPNYTLWLRYDDGTKGEVDLSEFAGRGVFKLWNDYDLFMKVAIGERGQLIWNEELDMCPDALYLRLTGKAPEDVFPNLREMNVDA